MWLKSTIVRTNHENERTITRGQGRNREVGSEGRLWETCELMDKNRIKGRRDVVSWHNAAKPFGLRTEVNAAVVQGSTVLLPGEASVECVDRFKSTVMVDATRAVMYVLSTEESADAIVVVSESVSSRRSRHGRDPVKTTPSRCGRRAELDGQLSTEPVSACRRLVSRRTDTALLARAVENRRIRTRMSGWCGGGGQ